jgi:hypothetical protein
MRNAHQPHNQKPYIANEKKGTKHLRSDTPDPPRLNFADKKKLQSTGLVVQSMHVEESRATKKKRKRENTNLK